MTGIYKAELAEAKLDYLQHIDVILSKNLGHDARHVRFIDLEYSFQVPIDGIDSEDYSNRIIKDLAGFIGSTAQVEANCYQIAEVLNKPKVVDKMIKSYRQGIDKARSRQEGGSYTNFAKIHEAAIRDMIDRQYK